MTDEPTKAAIERAKALKDAVPSTSATYNTYGSSFTAFARHLDQVSETAKAWKSAWDDGKLAPLAVRDMANALILPDPEPDVLAELLGSDFELTWAGHEASADDLRTELAKRGYAITKTGEAGQ
tara:strand:+ start:7560 stop:7931 length:372 start_codon:yes stop_codon:yes gene_type:complete